MQTIRDYCRDFHKLSPISRYLLLLMAYTVLLLSAAAIATYLLAGHAGDYYTMLTISQQSTELARSCAGILGIGAAVFQYLSQATVPKTQ